MLVLPFTCVTGNQRCTVTYGGHRATPRLSSTLLRILSLSFMRFAEAYSSGTDRKHSGTHPRSLVPQPDLSNLQQYHHSTSYCSTRTISPTRTDISTAAPL